MSAESAAHPDNPLVKPFQEKALAMGFGQKTHEGPTDTAFSLSRFILPSSMLASGTLITATPWLHENIDYPLRDWVQSSQPERLYFDDWLQFVPVVSVLLLKGVGLESRHDFFDLVTISGGSCILGHTVNSLIKNTCSVARPGKPDECNSFTSGHTLFAFMGAEILRREYGEDYPLVAIAGYLVATGVACMRIWNDRHYFSDVLGGAGLALLSVGVIYSLVP